MALEARLLQKLGTSLLMTPQLQQAIKLLQLGRLEYQEAIQRELLENPMLEESRDGEEAPQSQDAQPIAEQLPLTSAEQPSDDSSSGEPEKAFEEFFENIFSDQRGSALPKGSIDFEDRPSIEATLTKQQTLHDYLLSQLRLVEFDREDAQVIQYLVGNIDKDGYLCVSDDEVLQAVGCAPEQIERALATIHRLEPSGIGARNLRECLLLQLDDLGLGDSLAARIVRDHLEKLEARKVDQIIKAENVEPSAVHQAITTIRDLEPRPGRPFSDEEVRYAIPDLYITKVGAEYVVTLNEEGLPRLRINPDYLRALKQEIADGAGDKTYLTDRLKAAQFLIRSIHQRQSTILKVAQSLVKFQREFFEFGLERLKPLTLKEVADDIGMHESTVSRVTTNKFAHTPQGVFELKFFFTTGIHTNEGDVSSSSVKDKIRKIIEAESSDAPVSDQQIVDLLKADGVDIARRTVAKYRESMRILSSSQRKKLF